MNQTKVDWRIWQACDLDEFSDENLQRVGLQVLEFVRLQVGSSHHPVMWVSRALAEE